MVYGDMIVVGRGLRKRFGDGRGARRDRPGAWRPGPCCGLLGPNGAGKTTAVRILTTLLRADGGRALVAGVDVARDPAAVRRRIGLVGQNAAVDEVLSGRQNLVLFGRLYHLGRRARARAGGRVAGALRAGGHGQQAGQRSTRAGCAAGWTSPPGLILSPAGAVPGRADHGPGPARAQRGVGGVRALVAEGTTVLLTTQYLEEADQLADRIAVIDRGRVIAEDTPAELKAALGGDWIDVVVRDPDEVARAAALLARWPTPTPEIDPDARRVSAPVRRPDGRAERRRARARRRRRGHRPAPADARRGLPGT